jgi:hypothetical protein
MGHGNRGKEGPMFKTMIIIASIVLVLHGLIHLMGTAVYMKLGTVEGLKYKTTLLGGRWDLGAGGIWVFGALWAVAAVGFVVPLSLCWPGGGGGLTRTRITQNGSR